MSRRRVDASRRDMVGLRSSLLQLAALPDAERGMAGERPSDGAGWRGREGRGC
jgi:hypothetical protein